MDFINSPAERTTAITDAMLAVQCLAIVALLPRKGSFRTWTWRGVFGAMALASALGAVAHGFEMTSSTNAALWAPLNLALGLVMALLAVTAVTHTRGEALGRRCLRPALLIGLFFFMLTQLANGSFVYFIAYEATTILVVLSLYAGCLRRRNRPSGSMLLALGVTLSLVAAMVDVLYPLHVVCVWEFDNHGLFHLLQMVALIPLAIGAAKSCSATEESSSVSQLAPATP